ncbi:MAG: PEP-utilizing enzyme [Candidatus Diapherotrites archaeon]
MKESHTFRLSGVPVSKGQFVGFVKRVDSVKKAFAVSSNDVVVVRNNSPLFGVAFLKAGAVVSEVGGTLSHLAIVSREMGIPCVLEVANAFELLKEDSKVLVDADKGEIVIEQ